MEVGSSGYDAVGHCHAFILHLTRPIITNLYQRIKRFIMGDQHVASDQQVSQEILEAVNAPLRGRIGVMAHSATALGVKRTP
jgi:hypothetical protein